MSNMSNSCFAGCPEIVLTELEMSKFKLVPSNNIPSLHIPFAPVVSSPYRIISRASSETIANAICKVMDMHGVMFEYSAGYAEWRANIDDGFDKIKFSMNIYTMKTDNDQYYIVEAWRFSGDGIIFSKFFDDIKLAVNKLE